MVVYQEHLHPRDTKGRYREKLNLRGAGGSFTELDRANADEWGRGNFSEWGGSLDKKETIGVRAYASSAYFEMNNHLRHRNNPERSSDIDPNLKMYMETMMDAVNRSEIPENVVVHRSMYDPQLQELWESGNIIGATASDEGFMSTTLSRDALDMDAVEDFPLPMAATIEVPKGARGAYLGELTGYPEEQELLLQSGTTAEIIGAEIDENGVLQLRMRVVEQLLPGESGVIRD